jgi:hypothetical protein
MIGAGVANPAHSSESTFGWTFFCDLTYRNMRCPRRGTAPICMLLAAHSASAFIILYSIKITTFLFFVLSFFVLQQLTVDGTMNRFQERTYSCQAP